MNTTTKPYANSSIAKFMSKRIDELASRMSQKEIALKAGFKTVNIMSMMKNGDAKVPLDRIGELAKALEVDPKVLFRMALEQHLPVKDKSFASVMDVVLSDNERAIIEAIRETNSSDPGLNDQRRAMIREAFAA